MQNYAKRMDRLQTSHTINTQEEEPWRRQIHWHVSPRIPMNTPQKWGGRSFLVRRRSFDGIYSWGRVGSAIRDWSHRVVQHKVVPADCCQRVGAAVEPANPLDEVLVLPIPVPAKRGICGQYFKLTKKTDWSAATYTSRSSVFSTTREQSSLTDASMGALGWGNGTEFQLCSRASDGVRITRQRWRSPVCWEGQLVHSASMNGLHVHRLRFQEVRHSHLAQLIT